MSRPQVIALVIVTFVVIVGGTFLVIGLLQSDSGTQDGPGTRGPGPVPAAPSSRISPPTPVEAPG